MNSADDRMAFYSAGGTPMSHPPGTRPGGPSGESAPSRLHSDQALARTQLHSLVNSAGFDPEFSMATGAPVNTAARRLCVLQWRAGDEGGGSVRNLPLAEVRAATDGFSELCLIGNGGSCKVFQGQLWGHLVAVKVLEVPGGSKWGSSQQFAAEMKVLTGVLPFAHLDGLVGWLVGWSLLLHPTAN